MAKQLAAIPLSTLDEVKTPDNFWIFGSEEFPNGTIESRKYKLENLVEYAKQLQFERRISLNMEADTHTMPQIPIVSAKNIPCTITQDNVTDKLSVQDGSISVTSDVDITKAHTMHATSKIIPFGAICELNRFKILDNIPAKYGLSIDSSPDLISSNAVSNGNIEAGEFYMVRSTDNKYADITYNNKEYSSSLAVRNNILKGIEGINSFVVKSGNPILYKVSDLALQRTIQIRIVDCIPSQQIASGALLPSYWYLVEHDNDQSNTTDYITYNGVKYGARDSFCVVPGTTSFSKNGNIHLRRCWHKDFDYNTEATDKAFWGNRQKPRWIDVAPDYLMCMMKNNSGTESEMKEDSNGNYIASGYNGFYDMVLGAGGVPIPEYPIKGAYLQMRIVLTTLNPM